jgi:soluble lytic murein transglycosylase
MKRVYKTIISIINSIFLITVVILSVLILLANSNWFWDMINPIFYRELIYKYSIKYDIDPLLAAAIVKVESSFQPYAKSPKGAIGLMQVMPETGREIARKLKLKSFTIEDLYDPEINLQIGFYYLTMLREKFNGNIYLTLAAYNGGYTNVQKWIKDKEIDKDMFIEQIPFEETKEFIHKVMKNYQWFKNVQKIKNMLQFKWYSKYNYKVG